MNGALSPWVNSPRLGLIGNPENRRIRDFQKAFQETAVPGSGSARPAGCEPACLSYETLLGEGASLESRLANLDAELLRIDSPGENASVAAALIALGGGPADCDLAFGEIGYLREYHRGFCTVLDAIKNRAIPCVNAPSDIKVMFDKWECHRRFVAAGVARPESTLAPNDFPALLEQIRARRTGRIFLKPLHGSSASGVCAFRWAADAMQLIAPLRIQSERGRTVLVNSLRVHTYTTLADIELILGRLLPQGMISEKWIPKLSLPGGAVDLRVLVIAGQARHWVVRQSRHPMTNLHLGNQRGDPGALLQVIGAECLDKAFALAVRATACFPGTLSAGVDILLDTRHRALVGEINAFGDLLPRLLHQGQSAYEAISWAIRARHTGPPAGSIGRMGRIAPTSPISPT